MVESETFMIFLCSGATKAGDKKLSFRVASQLQAMGIGDIGSLQDLSHQQNAPPDEQKKMIFINDCRSGCVNILTQGFDKTNYVYVDVSPFLGKKDVDIHHLIQTEVLTTLNEKWNYSPEAHE